MKNNRTWIALAIVSMNMPQFGRASGSDDAVKALRDHLSGGSIVDRSGEEGCIRATAQGIPVEFVFADDPVFTGTVDMDVEGKLAGWIEEINQAFDLSPIGRNLKLYASSYRKLTEHYAPLHAPFSDPEAVHVLFMGDGLPLFTDYAGQMMFSAEEKRHLVVINLSPFSGLKNPAEVGKVLIHELGHYFGLYHTHHGDGTGLEEAIVRDARCAALGDGLCDTPAEPVMLGLTDAACRYIGGARDADEKAYDPDAIHENFMAYVHHACMRKFTLGQQRMLADVADLLSCRDPSDQRKDLVLTTFPNPFVDRVTIRVEGDFVSEVRILDASGRLVRAFPRGEWTERNLLHETIEWSPGDSLPAGIYTVQAIQGKDKPVRTVRIVKVAR